MKRLHVLTLLVACIALVNCKSSTKLPEAQVSGSFTVADSIDKSGDYSGIRLLITNQTNPTNDLDTLLLVETDSTGAFMGEVVFPEQGLYPFVVSRNGQNLFISQLILADQDTIAMSAELPGINTNLKIDSRENRAIDVYNRVDNGFNRVVRYINAGQIADSLINDELLKWSSLYWEVYENHSGTIASKFAARESITLLNGLDNDLMMNRLDQTLDDDFMIDFAASFGRRFVADTKGFDAAVRYLDSLQGLTNDNDLYESLDRNRIEFYFDSTLIDEAKVLLSDFERKYKNDSLAMQWAQNIGYELSYLAPGYRVPDFSFTTQDGELITPETQLGKPYLLEITPVANRLYQDQYDRTVVIHQIYQNYNLEIYTIPLDKSMVTVEAFFDDRVRHWPIAQAGSFDMQILIEKFNITRVPTRLLIDHNGIIVRKYIAEEFSDVISGLNQIINQLNQDS